MHPCEVVSMFEPIDVLDGATELVDQDGTVIVIRTADLRMVDANEYPADRTALYCEIRRHTGASRSRPST